MRSVFRLYSLPIVLGVFASVNCALFLFFITKTILHGPMLDALDWVYFYGNRPPSCNFFCYLWEPAWDPHVQHRVVFSRILLAFDLRVFGRVGPSFMTSGLVLIIATAVAIGREIIKSDLPNSWKYGALAVAVMLITPVNIVITVSVPIYAVYLQTCTFALFSLILLDGNDEENPFSNYRRTAAILAACCAAFGVSAGLMIWPVLIWSAWRSGLTRPWIVGIAVVGITFTSVYSWHLSPHVVQGIFTLSGIVQSFDYTVRFLGLPWSRLPLLLWPGRLIGFGMLCIGSIAALGLSFSGRPITRAERIGLGLILFAVLIAASAPLARLDLSLGAAVPIRYGMFVVLLHSGLLLLSLKYLYEHRHLIERIFAPWAVVTVCAIWLAQQIVAGEYTAATVDQFNDAWSHFIAGEWNANMVDHVYPDRDIAEEHLAYLRRINYPLGN